jgi:5-methylcytosine-specific restriction endonuclease McrA
VSAEHKRLRKMIFERDGYRCRWCGKPTRHPVLDHVIPVSRGGTDDPDNLCTACPDCNQRRGADG